LRGHARFDADYQHPTYSRPRAGSAASGGSAGSRYDIDRRSPGLPPMPRSSPKRVIAEPLYESQWSRKPSTHARELDRRSRYERPLSDYARYARPYASSSISSQEDKVLFPGPPRTHVADPLPSPAPCEPLMLETEKSSRAECDICGLEIEINRKCDWQLVQSYFSPFDLTFSSENTYLRICDLINALRQAANPLQRRFPAAQSF
jgi:hypothetical protein